MYTQGFKADPADIDLCLILDSQIDHICETYDKTLSNNLNNMQQGLIEVLRNQKDK